MDTQDTSRQGVLRYDVLMWAGITGSALSLFLKLDGVIAMSPWATALVGHWTNITQWVADAVTGLLGLGRGLIPREFAVLLAFVVSVLATVLGVRLKSRALAHERAKGGLRLPHALLLVPLVILAIALSITGLWIASRTFSSLAPLPEAVRGKPGLVLALLVMAFVSSAPIALFGKKRADALAFTAIFAPVPVILAHIPVLMKTEIVIPVSDISAAAVSLGIALGAALVPVALYLAPADALNRRFIFVLVGVLLLAALNAIASA